MGRGTTTRSRRTQPDEMSAATSPASSRETASVLSPEDREFLRQELDSRIRKEVDLLKDTLGLATKILSASAFVFVLIFALLGWRTWGDISTNVEAYVKERADKLLYAEGSGANVKERLEDLVNRAVIANAKIASASQSEEEGNEIALDTDDWKNLKRWIQRPELSNEDFASAISVLNMQADERKREDAYQLLNDLVSPSSADWIAKQPEKVRIIMYSFKSQDLGRGVVELLASDDYDTYMKIDAVNYINEVRYKEATDRLFEIYRRNKDEILNKEVIAAIARINPGAEGLVPEAEAIINETPSAVNKEAVARIFSALASADEEILSRSEMQSLMVKSLQYFANNRVFLVCGGLSKGTSNCDRYYFWTPESSRLNAVVSKQELENSSPYWEFLSKAAEANDLDTLKRILPISLTIGPTEPSGLILSADPGAKIRFLMNPANEREEELSNLDGFEIVSAEGKLIGKWTEGENTVVAEIVALSGTNFRFEIPVSFMK